MSITREALRESVARALYEFEPCQNVEGIVAWCDLDAWDEDGATREEWKVVADAVMAVIIPACQEARPMADHCEHCNGNGWVWQEYSTISGGDYQKCYHCMKAPMQPDPQPTTWVSRPVCATDAMIEAGCEALRAAVVSPTLGDRAARRVVQAIVNAALKASPKPPENDPETGDRTDG